MTHGKIPCYLFDGVTRPFQSQQRVVADRHRLRALFHQSPRAFGKATSLWTLDLAAERCFTEGIINERVTGETIRVTLTRLGVRWQRAKQWITGPDPAYRRKKRGGIG